MPTEPTGAELRGEVVYFYAFDVASEIRLDRARELLAVPKPQADADVTGPNGAPTPCPCCGGSMIIIETFAPGCQPHYQPSTTTVAIRIDTS